MGRTSEQAKVNLKKGLKFQTGSLRKRYGPGTQRQLAGLEKPRGAEQDALSFLDRIRQEEKSEQLPRRRR